MLQEALDLQKNAVKNLIYQASNKNELTFKAPTGSGKTHMMADMMNQIFQKDKNVVFLVSTLSKGGLAEQNYCSFKRLKDNKMFPLLNPYLINTDFSGEERPFIELDYNIYILPRDLYKKGGILMRGVLEGFLKNITQGPLLGGQDKEIYLIKDECHIKTKNLDDISSSYFSKVFNFSATPKLKKGQKADVEITKVDAENAKLIKKLTWGKDEDSLEDAINKFEEIKTDYRNMLGVNPCLIIQISNKNKADEELKNTIFPVLNKEEHQDLKWMLIVDKDKDCDTNDSLKKLPVKKWKNYAKESLSPIDIIIFKMTISEGWDIPRACMLYQIRDTQSKQLDEQVIGRIRRNPRLTDFETLNEKEQELAMTAWVWGIEPKEDTKYQKIKLKDGADKEIQIKTTKLNSLDNIPNFNIENFLKNIKPSSVSKSVFDLYGKYISSNEDVKLLCSKHIKSVDDWYMIAENIDKVEKEIVSYSCNYEKSMSLKLDENGRVCEASLPLNSIYITSNLKENRIINIEDCVWEKAGENIDNIFVFDSEAEKKWAEILIKVSKNNKIKKANNILSYYLWGKNYLDGSEIKYEYYLNGYHFSFPDFVMIDSIGGVHLFEVKSVNNANDFNIDTDEYNNKINELSKCYKQASKLTNHIFYLPILQGEIWKIKRYKDGAEDIITDVQLITSLKDDNSIL